MLKNIDLRLSGAFVFLFLALFFFYFYVGGTDIGFLGFDSSIGDKAYPVASFFLTVIAMLGGIFFGSIHDEIKNKEDTEAINLLKEAALVLKRKRFINAILVSPVLFIGIYVAAKTEPDHVIATLLAFQNGFFCDAIMKKKP